MASLHDLTIQYKMLQDFIEEGNLEGFELALSQIEGDIGEKLEGYASVVKNIESDVNGLAAEIKRLTERKQSYEKSIKRMKERMYEALQTVEGKKVKTTKFTFYVQSNKPSLVLDENLVPQQFKHTEETVVIDKTAIEEKLKQGEKVEGAELKQSESLRIR